MAVFACIAIAVGAHELLEGVARFVSIDFARDGGRGDAVVDWRAARLFFQGISPYTPEGLRLARVAQVGFGHPPTTPFWFLPLAPYDYATMANIVALLGWAMTLVQVAIVVFTLRFPVPYAVTVLVFGAVAASAPALEHARVIQLSAWIGFAYAVAWRSLRQRRDWLGGVALGLACTIKPFPGVIVFFLLLRGRFRAVAFALSSFLVVAAVMAWRWGLQAWSLFFAQQNAIAARWLGSLRNSSIHGVLRWALRPNACTPPKLAPDTISWLGLGAAGLVLVVALMVTWVAFRRQPDEPTFDRSFATFAVLSAFLNPWVWEHYLLILILPVLIAVHAIFRDYGLLLEQWFQHTLRSWRLVLFTPLAVGTLSLLYLVTGRQNYPYTVSTASIVDYCSYTGAPAVKAWLGAQVDFHWAILWLPWVVTLLSLLGLLLYRHPLRER
jgi:hypothetical protein